MKLKLTIAAVIVLAAHPAGAQAVWRCGNSYGEQPCAGGSTVAVPPAATAAEAARASAVAREDMKRAEAMEKARLAQARNAPKAIVIGPQAPASAPAAKMPRDGTKPKAGRLEQFTAVAPGSSKRKHKRKRG